MVIYIYIYVSCNTNIIIRCLVCGVQLYMELPSTMHM